MCHFFLAYMFSDGNHLFSPCRQMPFLSCYFQDFLFDFIFQKIGCTVSLENFLGLVLLGISLNFLILQVNVFWQIWKISVIVSSNTLRALPTFSFLPRCRSYISDNFYILLSLQRPCCFFYFLFFILCLFFLLFTLGDIFYSINKSDSSVLCILLFATEFVFYFTYYIFLETEKDNKVKKNPTIKPAYFF